MYIIALLNGHIALRRLLRHIQSNVDSTHIRTTI